MCTQSSIRGKLSSLADRIRAFVRQSSVHAYVNYCLFFAESGIRIQCIRRYGTASNAFFVNWDDRARDQSFSINFVFALFGRFFPRE